MTATATHAAHRGLQFAEGALVWGGRTVNEWVDEFGHTPLYLYDRRQIGDRVAALRAAMPAALRLHYAMKANPLPELVTFMAALVDGLDVASAGEMKVALASGAAPEHVSFAGPGKRPVEIEAAVEAGVTLNVESQTEIERIADTGRRLGKRPKAAIRINPDFELKTSGMKMGGYPSQFGIDAEKVPAAIERVLAHDIDFRGFHIYSGSQNLRSQAIIESIEKTVDLVIELAGAAAVGVNTVNLGGGLGIPYFPNEQALDLAGLGAGITPAVERLVDTLGCNDVVIELGRYLVGEAGIYVTRVMDVKDSRGTAYAICDGGLHHHLAASGNFGQVLRKNYPLTLANRTSTDTMQATQIVGPLCTPLDLLGDKVPMPRLEIGDLLAIHQSGAYGASASPALFLSQPGYIEKLVG